MSPPSPFDYRLVNRLERIGKHFLELQCLADLDETIDALFEYLLKEGRESLLEELCPYFGVVWPAARALSERLAGIRPLELLRGKKTLELGCGLAVPSLLLARLGARVTATDFHPEVPRFLERNLALNGLSASALTYLHLDWQKGGLPDEKFDWVIGSDILYEQKQPELVADAIRKHLLPGGRVLIADPARPYLQPFIEAMEKQGFPHRLDVHRTPDRKEVFLVEFGESF